MGAEFEYEELSTWHWVEVVAPEEALHVGRIGLFVRGKPMLYKASLPFIILHKKIVDKVEV